jgi:large subunit ribosomal protein L29
MKAQELRELGGVELAGRLTELEQELFNLRFQRATSQLTDLSRIRQVRRDIARAKTILRQVELKAEVQ